MAARFSVSDQDPFLQFKQEQVVSPGGYFMFGPQMAYGESKPTSLTFWVDGSCSVYDFWGRAMKGVVLSDATELLFAPCGPDAHMPETGPRNNDVTKASPFKAGRRPGKYASHLETVLALRAEGYDLRQLSFSGFPQLPYPELAEIKDLLPPTPHEQLLTIKTPELRQAALRIALELSTARDEQIAREEMQAQRELDEALAKAKSDKVAATTPANGTTQTTTTTAPAATSKRK